MKLPLVSIVLVALCACSSPGGGGGPGGGTSDVGAGDTGGGGGDGAGDTLTTACEPKAIVCEGQLLERCLDDGSGFEVIATCSDGVCVDGACRACVPSQRRCTAGGAVETCGDGGGWSVTDDCAAEGLACVAGSCQSPCVRDPKANDNSGCDYWAIDLDNHPRAQNGPYAVIVSNLSQRAARVKVSRKDSATALAEVVLERDVEPGQLSILSLPQRNMTLAGVFWAAYRVESTVPIIAYQFNPLANVDVFSNDATILLPTNTLGLEYYVVSRFQLTGVGLTEDTSIPYRGTFAVAASAARTNVTVTPTTRTLAGLNMPTMSKGQSYTFALEPFQVLNVKSDEIGGDLTGTHVVADKPVAVFGGHEAALSSQGCCADHLEHQLYPVSTWGTTYVATKSKTRQAEQDYWRIVASEDGTNVQFAPTVSSARTLHRGEWYEFVSRGDFVITADKPISVAQTLASSYEVVYPQPYSDCTVTETCATAYVCTPLVTGQSSCLPPTCDINGFDCPVGHVCTQFGSRAACSPVGDPALIMIPPVKQWRADYVFLTPDKYQDDFVNIVADNEAQVRLDDVLLLEGSFTAIAGSDYRVARLEVNDGVHRIISDTPISVIAYGWDRDVSYGYAAGLNLVEE